MQCHAPGTYPQSSREMEMASDDKLVQAEMPGPSASHTARESIVDGQTRRKKKNRQLKTYQERSFRRGLPRYMTQRSKR
jgi:hypothetical protein